MDKRPVGVGRLIAFAGLILLAACSRGGNATADHPSAPALNTPAFSADLQAQQSALNMVMNQKDVQAWLSYYAKKTAAPYQSPVVKVDHREQNDYIVHVYEQLQDGQTSTFGWYRINIVTGSLQKFQQSSSASSH
ncbi:MAG TPA: hypothetical protein VHA78_03080 [Candidatus Peribacteraceae bacterium]|nr:hypothetical protein [Candidatus Peribacteraceae bacterium]